jgi:hypothetical protein
LFTVRGKLFSFIEIGGSRCHIFAYGPLDCPPLMVQFPIATPRGPSEM